MVHGCPHCPQRTCKADRESTKFHAMVVYFDITVLVIHDRQLTVSMKHSPSQNSRNDSYGQGAASLFETGDSLRRP
jgi:hypothetical protein